MTEVVLVGGFVEIIELCEVSKIKIFGIIDNMPKNNLNGYKILCTDNTAKIILSEILDKLIIITPDLPKIRIKLSNYYNSLGCSFYTLISPFATLSKSAIIGKGSIIQSQVNISAEVEIGTFVKINTCANIMHNVRVGDYTTIAPNAVILGYVTIGKGCYIGANATVLPHINIPDGVVIGAGAVVTKSIKEENVVFAGIPAKKITK